jgi:hypothetical protein
MRAGLSAAEDESLPGFDSEAPSIEVAADFTGIYKILMWQGRLEAKTAGFAITKVPAKTRLQRGIGKLTHRIQSNYALYASLLLLRVISS